MGSFDKHKETSFYSNKKLFHYLIIVSGIMGAIVLLSLWKYKRIETDNITPVNESVQANDTIEIQLALIDGKYQVDRREKTTYIDLT